MSRTERRDWLGHWAPERHQRQLTHCPEHNCEWCTHGKTKRPWNRRNRHQHQKENK